MYLNTYSRCEEQTALLYYSQDFVELISLRSPEAARGASLALQ